MPTVATNYSKIPLKTLLAIRENQYRSKDASKDYDPELIEQEIWRKQDQLNEKQLRRRFKEFDEQQKAKEELKAFLATIRQKGPQYLSESTMNQIVNDIAYSVADFI